MKNQVLEKPFDLAIIGAGPAGISCALAAKKYNLKAIMLDKSNIVNSIINFPKNMTFFSTSDLLELDNIPQLKQLWIYRDPELM